MRKARTKPGAAHTKNRLYPNKLLRRIMRANEAKHKNPSIARLRAFPEQTRVTGALKRYERRELHIARMEHDR